MGALSSNRKRGDDYFRTHSLSTAFDQSNIRISKKPKLSLTMSQTTPETIRAPSPNSVVSLISQIPDRKAGFSREVHAPVRNSKFESRTPAKNTETTAGSRETPADEMGAFSFFSLQLRRAKESAIRSLRYMVTGKPREKDVIEVVDSEDEGRDDISNDSSIEELQTTGSMGRWKGRQGAVDNLQQQNGRTAEKEVRSFDSSVVTDGSYDDSGVPCYRRLHDSLKKTDDKLASINFNIEIHKKRLQGLHLLRPHKEEPIEEDVTEECFVPLTDEETKEISRAFSNSNRRKVLIAHANSCIDITGEKLQCLKPGAWLNDEVINLYLELLKEREKRVPHKFLKCHFFNTFFYKKLISGQAGYNYQTVRRWTSQKKLGYSLLECDKIFVPIHKEIHWCLAVINRKDEKFQYLDSLGGVDNQVLNRLARYFVDEVKDKCGKDINVSSWEKEFVTELPEQLNGFDCGMFMIKYADFYSRDIGLRFSQDDIPYFRQRTAKEILKLRAD